MEAGWSGAQGSSSDPLPRMTDRTLLILSYCTRDAHIVFLVKISIIQEKLNLVQQPDQTLMRFAFVKV